MNGRREAAPTSRSCRRLALLRSDPRCYLFSGPHMVLYLIRHGSTDHHVRRCINRRNTDLDPQGLAQAEAIAARLAEDGVTLVLSSDLLRARRTAEVIAARTNATRRTTPLLRERDFGTLCGAPLDEVDPTVLYESSRPPGQPEVVPPGGESWGDFHARVSQAWAFVLAQARRSAGHVAVVTHGLVLGSIARHHLESEDEIVSFRPASVTVVDLAAPRPIVVSDCIEHLRGRPPQ